MSSARQACCTATRHWCVPYHDLQARTHLLRAKKEALVAFSPCLTLQQHILEEQRRHHPHATGEFSWLLSGITLAAKVIAAQVRRAGLVDVLGATGDRNVQGEDVQKLDVLANQALLHCLGARGNVA